MNKFPPSFPVMGPDFPAEKFREVDLSTSATGPEMTDPYHDLKKWVDKTGENGRYCCYGGYLEKRAIYTAAQYTQTSGPVRNIHIGVDVWWKAGTPVFAPFDGKLHSFANNAQPLDYGATIILEHQIKDGIFYTLYGHLSLNSLEGLETGMFIGRGKPFCRLGNPQENGGWYPHLHLQLILNLARFRGDYPGVVSEKDQNIMKNCPDPTFMVLASLSA
ncbi:MAG: peptidase M23 [Saprospirales bacterium]|nr:MAG: peptidase M23 [Saprospirales bacterium]